MEKRLLLGMRVYEQLSQTDVFLGHIIRGNSGIYVVARSDTPKWLLYITPFVFALIVAALLRAVLLLILQLAPGPGGTPCVLTGEAQPTLA